MRTLAEATHATKDVVLVAALKSAQDTVRALETVDWCWNPCADSPTGTTPSVSRQPGSCTTSSTHPATMARRGVRLSCGVKLAAG